MSTVPLGWHWLAQASGCAAPLDQASVLQALLIDLAGRLSLTIMAPPRVQPIAGGCAGIVLLGESHAAVHTRTAERAALVDIFSCVPLDPAIAEAVVRSHLAPVHIRTDLVERLAP
jgi:S-adenosylmethionine/arginine decarboxylase-like enzyme